MESSCSRGAMGWGAAHGPHPKLPVLCISGRCPLGPGGAVPAHHAQQYLCSLPAARPSGPALPGRGQALPPPVLQVCVVQPWWHCCSPPASWRSAASCIPSSSVCVLGQRGASTTVPKMILNRVWLPVRLLSQGLTSPLCPAPCCLSPPLPASPALFCFSSSLTWDPTHLFFSQPHKPGCSASLPPA